MKSAGNGNLSKAHRRVFPRRTFLKAVGLGLTAPAVLRPCAASDADLLAQARAQIEQHRKGRGTITLRTPDGKPLPGAQVEFQQTRHEFLFGCNFFMFDRLNSPDSNELYGRRFADLFNYATLGFYWSGYEPVQGRPNYDYTVQAANWCTKNGVACKGHPLVWDHPASVPRWLPSSIQEVERLSDRRVTGCVQKFKESIHIWDVVNEPTDLGRFKNPLNAWAVSLGASSYLKHNLKVARASNAAAVLLVNDYRVDAAFHHLLDDVRENGKPMFDAIGIQSHMHDGVWPLERVWAVCSRFSELKVPLHFTETTVVSGPRTAPGEHWAASNAPGEARQAEYVPDFYTMLFAHPSVRAITWWDFADTGAWQGAAAGLLRKNLSPKPAYEKLRDLLKKQWWTHQSGVTNGDGQFNACGFFGDYKLSVGAGNGTPFTRSIAWNRDASRNFDITVN